MDELTTPPVPTAAALAARPEAVVDEEMALFMQAQRKFGG